MDKIQLFTNRPGTQLLNYRVGDTSIYMKRDDLLDFAFGGNKVRLFEYIAADAVKQGAEKIITFGSIHSNHVRVAAATAYKLGIACDLILLYEDEKLTERQVGAMISLTNVERIMEQITQALTAALPEDTGTAENAVAPDPQ